MLNPQRDFVMRIFLPYTLFMIAAALFFGTCNGCDRWKDDVEGPTSNIVSELNPAAETKDDDVAVNIYLLFPQYKYIIWHARV